MAQQRQSPGTLAMQEETQRMLPAVRVCMHVLGIGRTDGRVMRSARALAQAGCKICVVDIEHDAQRSHRETVDDIEFRHVFVAAKWVTFYQPVKFLPWIAFKVLRIVRSVVMVVRTPADVYHAHDVTALPACYIAARLRRKLLVYDAHELPLVDPHQTRHRLLWKLSTQLLRVMTHRCDAIITVSPFLVQEFQRRYGGPPAAVVRNIPPYQAPPSSSRLRDRLGLDADARIALYQGNLQENRGLDLLVRAARALEPRDRIVLMGKDFMRGHIQALIAQEGVGDRVVMLPAVPYDELLDWTASADLGLIIYRPDHSPNVRYCLPNKVFEYLIAGVPVLASPLDAIARLLRAYDVGRVLPSAEPPEVGAAINALLGDASTLARMRRNAATAAQQDLNWEVESQRLIGVYQDLAQNRQNGRGPDSRRSTRLSDTSAPQGGASAELV